MIEFKDISKYANNKLENNFNLVRNLNYKQVDDKDCVITFIPFASQNLIDSVCLGLLSELYYQNNKLNEKSKIKANIHDYLKIFKQNNKIVRIDSFVNGENIVSYCAHYLGDNRVLVSNVGLNGSEEIQYILTEKNGDFVKAESIFTKSQLLLNIYEKFSETTTKYQFINYLPKADILKVQEYREGKFIHGKKLEFQILYNKSWVGQHRQANLKY